METIRTSHRLRIIASHGAVPGLSPGGAYYKRILHYAQQIRQTGDIDEIISVLDKALRETRQLHNEDEISSARAEVARAEQRISSLRRELATVSNLLREDPLTGALNRRGLDQAFQRESARAMRMGSILSVALIDLDDFKRLNDTHGHAAGDRALAHVSAITRLCLRPNDSLARYGGEEFLLLLPDTALMPAVAAVQRVQQALGDAPVECDGARLTQTFSAGVAQQCREEPFGSLIARADSALYQAKRSGKNRVCAAAGNP